MRDFLLIWTDSKGSRKIDWFDAEYQLHRFVENNDVLIVHEALEIINARVIEIDLN